MFRAIRLPQALFTMRSPLSLHYTCHPRKQRCNSEKDHPSVDIKLNQKLETN